MKQVDFKFREHGGARKGAGRKPANGRAGVRHRVRAVVTASKPVHVTLKVRHGIWSLRSARVFGVVRAALGVAARRSETFRVVQYSVQADHVHMLVEASDGRLLSKNMKGLCVRLARGINRVMKREGTVFKDRYHAHVLATVREVHNALAYVLLNARKHFAQVGRTIARGWIDPCSTAAYFDGWRQAIATREPELPTARSWLLAIGWRKLGPLDLNATPSAQPRP